jgi:uncharacterized protein (DUF58 family)
VLLLDTRRGAHAGTGAGSSFEFAVSAAASIGVHLAHEGLDGQLVTDTGALTATGTFEDVLLNSLAVIKPSRGHDLGPGVAALRRSSGLLIAVTGQLSPAAARQLAASRRDAGPAIALLLAVSTWSNPAQATDHEWAGPSQPARAETDQAAMILRAAGWRVACADASTQLAVAWQQLGALPSASSPAAKPPPLPGPPPVPTGPGAAV